ncbi:MAG: hypothetical protein Q7V43_32220 [Myxococcales bacterium]|nr:hypothetical protein [Myxococcales bacterium]
MSWESALQGCDPGHALDVCWGPDCPHGVALSSERPVVSVRSASCSYPLHLRDPLAQGSRVDLSPTQPVDVPPLNVLGVPAGYRLALTSPTLAGSWIDLGPVDLWARSTPMQRFFATHQSIATVTTDWRSGSLVLRPVGPWTGSLVFEELLLAAAAGELWLGRDHRAIADLTGYLGARPRELRLPDAVVDAVMERRYGPAGRGMAPTRSDWLEVFAGLSLCHIREYLPRDPGVGASIPSDARCVPLETLVELPGEVVGRGPRAYRATVMHRSTQVTHRDARRDGPAQPHTVAFGFGLLRSAETFPDVVTRGDELRLEAPRARPWSACVEGRCAPIVGVLDAAVTTTVLASGLMEIRPGRLEGRAARQGIAVMRVVTVDPVTDWVPVGLGRGDEGLGRWTALTHDEPDVFTFSRRSSRLDFSLSLSPAAVAAWNHRGPSGPPEATTVLVADLPLASARIHPPAATPPAALMLVARRGPDCPAITARRLRAEVPLDPRTLPVDAVFHLHLAQWIADDLPLRCLARASLRVRPERTVASAWPARTALVGDLQAVLLPARPIAVGLALPLLYGQVHVAGGFVVESAFAATALVDVDRGTVQRAGLSFTSSLSWGVSSAVPRLLSVGVLINVFTTGQGEHTPRGVAPYASLNLGALYDLLGGR